MDTVGYGDLSPQTPVERLFGIGFLLVATGVFSFTMSTIGISYMKYLKVLVWGKLLRRKSFIVSVWGISITT